MLEIWRAVAFSRLNRKDQQGTWKAKWQSCPRGQEKKVLQEREDDQRVNATDKLHWEAEGQLWDQSCGVAGNDTVGHFGGVADTKPCPNWVQEGIEEEVGRATLDNSIPEFSEKGIRHDGQYLKGKPGQREGFCKTEKNCCRCASWYKWSRKGKTQQYRRERRKLREERVYQREEREGSTLSHLILQDTWQDSNAAVTFWIPSSEEFKHWANFLMKSAL